MSLGCRLGHLHHQPDDVARGTELAVLPRRGDLAEHVFVEVALGVAVLHRHLGDEIDDLGEELRGRDREAGILHVPRIGRPVAAEGSEPREYMLGDGLEHRARFDVLEARPPHVVIGLAPGIGAFGEDAPFHRLLEARGLQLLDGLQVIKAAQEQQIGDLLDDFERVRDAARPEGIPDGVDLVADVTSYHNSPLPVSYGLRFTWDL